MKIDQERLKAIFTTYPDLSFSLCEIMPYFPDATKQALSVRLNSLVCDGFLIREVRNNGQQRIFCYRYQHDFHKEATKEFVAACAKFRTYFPDAEIIVRTKASHIPF